MKEKYYKKKASSILASIIVIITSLIILSTTNSSNVSAETSTATIRVKSFCSMTATVEPGEEHSISLIGGQYQDEIGLTTIQTFCNDPNGYAIYAIGYTGGDIGIENGTNTVLHGIDLGTSDYDIATGTATSGDISNWAMKLTAKDDTGELYVPIIESDAEGSFSSYHTIPANYTKVAYYSSNTDIATIGSSITTTYAAYISPTQPAGTYTGQVKYVLVHPASSLEPSTRYMQDVDQWANDIDVGDEVVAYDNRDNKSYTVRRMCMESTSNNDATWQEKEENCTDSMLWMTQNLDLDLNSSVALNSTNTDLNEAGSGAYSNGYVVDSDGVIYWTPATTTITSINTYYGQFNGWDSDKNKAYSADPDAGNPNNPWYATGELYNSNLCNVGGNNQTCNYLDSRNTVAPTYFSHTAFTGNGDHGKIGNYYNWSAAIASNDSSGLNVSTYNNIDNNPQNSICPRGWRLPIVSSIETESEFVKLNNAYNQGYTDDGSRLMQAPLYVVQSGNISVDGLINGAGYRGVYFSSTIYNANKNYELYFRSNRSNPIDADERSLGWTVRCVSEY